MVHAYTYSRAAGLGWAAVMGLYFPVAETKAEKKKVKLWPSLQRPNWHGVRSTIQFSH